MIKINRIFFASLIIFLLKSNLAIYGANIELIESENLIYYFDDKQQEFIEITDKKEFDYNTTFLTDENAVAEFKLDDGSVVIMNEDTKLKIECPKVNNRQLQLSAGNIKINAVKLNAGASFKITTPTAVCAVRGTDFLISVETEDNTELDVFEGAVETEIMDNSRAQKKIVNANESANIYKNKLDLFKGIREKSEIIANIIKNKMHIRKLIKTRKLLKQK